jgi:hypothetical protein
MAGTASPTGTGVPRNVSETPVNRYFLRFCGLKSPDEINRRYRHGGGADQSTDAIAPSSRGGSLEARSLSAACSQSDAIDPERTSRRCAWALPDFRFYSDFFGSKETTIRFALIRPCTP